MATIDDMPVKSISEMSDDELQEAIRAMRNRRSSATHAVKPAAEKKKATAKKVASKALELSKPTDIVAGLSPEQRAELLKELMK